MPSVKLSGLFLPVLILLICNNILFGQTIAGKKIKRQVYFTWGYNKDYFTRSTLHFHDHSAGYDFKLARVAAHDRPNFRDISSDITKLFIPQYDCRLGWFFKNKSNQGIEINFDHVKYVMEDQQTVHLQGTISDTYLNQDTLINPSFLQFEHTNGANFLLLNYFITCSILHHNKFSITTVGKAGAGTVIPKTDVTLFGIRRDNRFHFAGWLAGVEGDIRFTFLNHFYLEEGIKVAYADYTNVLVIGDGRANHSFGTLELIWGLGYQLSL